MSGTDPVPLDVLWVGWIRSDIPPPPAWALQRFVDCMLERAWFAANPPVLTTGERVTLPPVGAP